ncbi:cubilin-like [Orbicella faveolata]|uniref:cubilin-like n=1 Tax=Orbicella faveolata TaxID=48498 RepID=UPI0009E64637|nr:cubilin-like [Orbicella faveolata]
MPNKIYSLDNCMTLIFKSDESKRAEGFEAEYTSIDNSTELDPNSNCSSTKLLGSSNGTFFTPNWPLTYPPDAACSWTFSPPEEKIVRLFFMSFEMEGKHECDANRPSVTADEIRINGTNSTGGKGDIVPRICAKPDTLYYTIKQMRAVTVRFSSNRRDESSGAIAGYASYKKDTFNSSSPGCKAIQVPESTASTESTTQSTKASGKQTLAKPLGVVGAAVLAVAVFRFEACRCLLLF